MQAFAGRDATEAFLSYHRRRFPHEKLNNLLVRKISSKKLPNADQDYLELCDLIEKIQPRHRSYAPTSYYVKIAFLIIITLGLETYIHLTRSYFWYLSSIEGFLFALIGLNIQHDANHGAVSKHARINRWLGLLQNYIGGSSLDWIHQHVVQVRYASCFRDKLLTPFQFCSITLPRMTYRMTPIFWETGFFG